MDMNQMPMNQMPMGAAPVKKPAGLSIASMVCGIVAIVMLCCFYWLSVVLGLVAIILGAVALKKQAGGKGMAIAGLVCGILGVIPGVLMATLCAGIAAELNSIANM